MANNLTITILGSGTSSGVPRPFFGYGDGVDANNPKNNRLRASIVIEYGDSTILIDTSPDLRQQILNAKLTKISAVLYTHTHADHCHGIDELRWACQAMNKPIAIYGDELSLNQLRTRFDYCFTPLKESFYYKPMLIPYEIKANQEFEVAGLKILPILQDHGYSESLGFRIGNFAYSTDVLNLSHEALGQLMGLDYWIVDCLQMKPHHTHAHFDKTIGWIEQCRPKHAILTHLNYGLDYEKLAKLCQLLPFSVEPAYDNMQIICKI